MLKKKVVWGGKVYSINILYYYGNVPTYLEYNDDPKNINSKDNKMEHEKSNIEKISA